MGMSGISGGPDKRLGKVKMLSENEGVLNKGHTFVLTSGLLKELLQ